MSYDNIELSRQGAIFTLTLNRPEKRNALSLDTMLEIIEALQSVAASDADGLIIAANGPVFSAGHNFADMAGASADVTHHLFDTCTRMMDAVQNIPQPVIARVHALPLPPAVSWWHRVIWPSRRNRRRLPFRAARADCSATHLWWRWRATSVASALSRWP